MQFFQAARTAGLIAGLILVSATAADAASYVFTTIDPPSTPGGDLVRAMSINTRGQVLVQAVSYGTPFEFTDINDVYDVKTQTFSPLPSNPAGEALSTQAFAINNNGRIVGLYHPTGGYWQGYSYLGGKFSSVNDSGARFNIPFGINQSGDIVGTFGTGPTTEGYLFSKGKFTTIDGGTFPSDSTGLVGINNSGQIIGSYGPSGTYNYNHSFLDVGGVFTPIAYAGQIATTVSGINDHGTVVGGISNDSFATGTAFTYNNGVFDFFSVPGAQDTFANGIDDYGRIVGQYVDGNGGTHAFLATPLGGIVPEPETWALMLIGVLAAGGAMRQKRRYANLRTL